MWKKWVGYKWATLKTNLTERETRSKEEESYGKDICLAGKIPKIAITDWTGWEGNLGLKTAKIMKEFRKMKRAKPKKASVWGGSQ